MPRARRPLKPGTDATTTIASLRRLMDEFVTQRQWHKYHTPRNLAASIAVEAAELLELFQWLTPEEAREKSLHDPAFREALGDEIADVFLYLLSLVNTLKLDLSRTTAKKMEKNQKKYPPEKFQGRYSRPLAH